MKILFVSRLYPNEFNKRNGAVMHSQALELQKLGHEVRVISPVPYIPKIVKKYKKNWLEYSQLNSSSTFENIKVYNPNYIRIPFSLWSKSFPFFIKKSVKKMIREVHQEFDFDIVHCHMAFPDNYAAKYIADLYEVPLVTTIRSSDMDINSKKSSISNMIADTLKDANLIITPSPQLGLKLKEQYGFSSIHIGNGIYPHKLNAESTPNESINSIIDQFQNYNKIISISTLMKTKGIQYNIKAVANLVKEYPNLVYWIVGEGPYKNELLKLVKDLEMENHILFLGDVPHDSAMKLLIHADIYSMPSFRETFGLVYLEAMFFEKPILLCKNQALDGVVKHRESGMIVKPHSVEDICETINFLLKNPKLKEKISKKGKLIVANNYYWEKIGEDLVRVYESTK